MQNLTKKQLFFLIIIAGIILLVIGSYLYSVINNTSYEQFEEISEEPIHQTNENVENKEEEIVIHIAGQVKNPGIIRTKEGARIADIIEKAGGLTKEADITNINLAYIVEDGQKITIPTLTENQEQETISNQPGKAIPEENKTPSQQPEKTSININKANQEELMQLQGIGQATATKIIEYRKQNGNFKQIEDLKKVPRHRRSKI